MEKHEDNLDKLLKAELEKEAGEIMEEMDSDESLQDISFPEDLDEKMWSKIQEYEERQKAWLVTTTKNTAINYMKKRARECPKADIELFSDLYSKEYAESAEEHVFHKILQKEKVGYGWTILDALYEENENWYEAITMVYCLERKQKDVAESMGISIQALTGVLYRARKWVKIHYNSDDYTK